MKAAGPIGVVIDKTRGSDRESGGFSPLPKIDIVVRRSTAISPSLSWERVASSDISLVPRSAFLLIHRITPAAPPAIFRNLQWDSEDRVAAAFPNIVPVQREQQAGPGLFRADR